MKYVFLGLLDWVSFFFIFAATGLIFTIAGGMYDKYDIYETIESGALIATCLTIVVFILAIASPLVEIILK